MPASRSLRTLPALLLTLVLAPAPVHAAPPASAPSAPAAPDRAPRPAVTLAAPAALDPDEDLDVAWSPPGLPGDRLVLLGPDGRTQREVDADGLGSVRLHGPFEPGEHEIRYLGADDRLLAAAYPVVRAPEEAAACDPAPDEDSLRTAFDGALGLALRGLEARYGRRYTDVEYDVDVRVEVDGERGLVRAGWSGSAFDELIGERASASGEIDAEFRVEGCRWLLVGYDY